MYLRNKSYLLKNGSGGADSNHLLRNAQHTLTSPRFRDVVYMHFANESEVLLSTRNAFDLEVAKTT